MKRKVTFEELLRLCDKLSEEIKKLGSFQLVAVSRGGLIPGAIIAKKLGAPLNVLSIDGNGGVTALSPISVKETVVYIDDMTDRGRTARVVIEHHDEVLDYCEEGCLKSPVWCSVFVDHASPLLNKAILSDMPPAGYLFGEVAHDWIVMPHEEEDRVVEGDKGLFRDGSNKYATGK